MFVIATRASARLYFQHVTLLLYYRYRYRYYYRYRYRYHYRRNLPVRNHHAHTAATAPLLQLLKQLYSGPQPASFGPLAGLDQPAASITAR